MVLSAKSKANKKVRRKKTEMTSLVQGMAGVVFVSFIASVICAYLFFLVQPIVMKWFIELITKTVAPLSTSRHFKDDMDIGTFRKFYHQAHPVTFASSHHESNLNMIINHSYCTTNAALTTISNEEAQQECIDTTHEFCKVYGEDDATVAFAAITEKVLCGPALAIEALSIPRLRTVTPNLYEDISSFDGQANFIVSKSIYGVTERPTFKQHPQSWEYLMLGRKLWFLYRPGGVPPSGFNPRTSILDFLDNVYPSLQTKERPIEIIQEEGQIIYIPEGWYQASLPLPHPLVSVHVGNEPPLHNLLLTIWNSSGCTIGDVADNSSYGSEEGSKNALTCKEISVGPSDIFTLSVRQQSNGPQSEDSLYYHTEQGKKLLTEGQTQLAEEILRKATEGKDDFQSFYLLAKALVANGKLDEAEKYLRLAVSANRLDISPHIATIEMLLSSKRYDKAELAVRSAVALGFDDSEELNTFKYIFNIR